MVTPILLSPLIRPGTAKGPVLSTVLARKLILTIDTLCTSVRARDAGSVVNVEISQVHGIYITVPTTQRSHQGRLPLAAQAERLRGYVRL